MQIFVPVKKYVLEQVVQFDADSEHSLQLAMQAEQVQVAVSAKVPVTPTQSDPQVFPFRKVLLMQDRQVVEVPEQVTQGEVQAAQTPELLKNPVGQALKHYDPFRTNEVTQLVQDKVVPSVHPKQGEVHCTQKLLELK